MKAPAVAFLNRKGGVGKTSTCHHLAGAFAEAGERVLLCDMDPQASASQGLLGARAALSLPASRTVTALFDAQVEIPGTSLIHETGVRNVYLAAACAALNRFNVPEPETYPHLHGALALFLAEVGPFFDRVLIDCPPTLNLCSWAALLAADGVVVPVTPEDYGAQGIIFVNQMVDRARTANPRLRHLGYLLTMVTKRLAIHRAYRQQLAAEYREAVFTSSVPMLSAYKEAITAQVPVTVYRPHSPAADAIRVVAQELKSRACNPDTAGVSPVDALPVPV